MIVIDSGYSYYPRHHLSVGAAMGAIFGAMAGIIAIAIIVTAIAVTIEKRDGKDASDKFVDNLQCIALLAAAACACVRC